MFVDKITLEEKISQMIMINFAGRHAPSGVIDQLNKCPWGGFILFPNNFQSYAQVKELITTLQNNSRFPLFVAVDQEGGMVSPLRGIIPEIPGQMALGSVGCDETAYQVAYLNAGYLLELGFNINFAPVVDVNNNPHNPVIGIRSYGDCPALVSRLGTAAVKGYQDAGMIATAKHFPGHGDTSLDSHLDLPYVREDKDRLRSIELAPFQQVINNKVEALMTAHIVFPAFDNRPATLSEVILTKLLRQEMGFKGLVITDSMEMRAISHHYSLEKAAVLAVLAGSDIILACGSEKKQHTIKNAILQAVEKKQIPQTRINESVERILRLKERYILTKREKICFKDQEIYLNNVYQKAVTMIKNDNNLLPLGKHKKILLVEAHPQLFTNVFKSSQKNGSPLGDYLKEDYPQIKTVTLDHHPTKEARNKIISLSADFDVVIMAVMARSKLPEKITALVESLKQTEKPIAFIALGNPYHMLEIGDVSAYLAVYGYDSLSAKVLAEVIKGESRAEGKLPVTINSLYTAGYGL